MFLSNDNGYMHISLSVDRSKYTRMLNKRHHYTSIGITNCLPHVERHCNLPTNQVSNY